MIFLIHYDRRAGTIKTFNAYGESDRLTAESDRMAFELAAATGDETEIVLLEAGSEADLRKTHARYFSSTHELAKSAADEGLVRS